MPSYKLTYFNVRGQVEVTRIMFAMSGTKYEDVRVDREQWEKLKSGTPFGQLPTLEVDGKTYCQSAAIARYVASKAGMYGKNDEEKFKNDMCSDCIRDSVMPLRGFIDAPDDKKPEILEKYIKDEKQMPESLKKLEKLINEKGFLVSDKIMWADVGLYFYISEMQMHSSEVNQLLDKHPKINALVGKVAANDKVAQWVKQRPQTKF